MLRLFGATIGSNVHIYPTAIIAIPWNLTIGDFTSVGDGTRIYNLGRVTIGRYATVSQGAHLCAGTHDHLKKEFPLIKAQISIEEGAWVCADAYVGPNVTVGSYAIVGARAVATKDISAWTIVGGNPARVLKHRAPMQEERTSLGDRT